MQGIRSAVSATLSQKRNECFPIIVDNDVSSSEDWSLVTLTGPNYHRVRADRTRSTERGAAQEP
jgi:hypothetical protein